jgi:hypothetical protein
VVVDDTDVVRIALPPDEADAPDVVDSDCMLPSEIAFEGFEPQARPLEIVQGRSCVEQGEFPEGDPFESLEAADAFLMIESFRVTIPEAPDHAYSILYNAYNVKHTEAGAPRRFTSTLTEGGVDVFVWRA